MREPLFEHRLDLGGFGTRALELEGDGPPLLLLHGYADSADTWRLLLARLGRQGRRALAVDLPGFGAADRLAREEPVLPQLDRLVGAAAHHLSAEAGGARVVVAGNSLGGCAALRAAADPSLPIAAAVPIAPAGFDHATFLRTIEAQPVLRHLLAAPLPVPEVAVRAAVGEVFRQLAFARPRAASSEVVGAFSQHLRSRRDLRRYLATGNRLMPELLNRPIPLDRLTVPLMLIWGDHDRMVGHRGARHLLDVRPDTRFELLRDVGHCPQLEVPDRIVELLDDFGTGVASGGRTRARAS